jgi:hypothetical protein
MGSLRPLADPCNKVVIHPKAIQGHSLPFCWGYSRPDGVYNNFQNPTEQDFQQFCAAMERLRMSRYTCTASPTLGSLRSSIAFAAAYLAWRRSRCRDRCSSTEHSRRPQTSAGPSAPGNEGRGMLWYKQSAAFQRRAAINHQLRWPFARGHVDLLLSKTVRSAILGSKRPGIWRMSG